MDCSRYEGARAVLQSCNDRCKLDTVSKYPEGTLIRWVEPLMHWFLNSRPMIVRLVASTPKKSCKNDSRSIEYAYSSGWCFIQTIESYLCRWCLSRHTAVEKATCVQIGRGSGRNFVLGWRNLVLKHVLGLYTRITNGMY